MLTDQTWCPPDRGRTPIPSRLASDAEAVASQVNEGK
jgi:hypothetical protein